MILIGVAVLATSLLIGRQEAEVAEQQSRQTEQDSFVSRIVITEESGGELPAPATPPAEEASAPPDPGSRSAPDQSVKIEPVLEFERRLPQPIPRLNTVGADEPEELPPEVQTVEPRAEVRANTDESWIVRVGAFSEASNAESVLMRLKEGGYEAFSAPVEVSGKRMMRVWIGPYPDRKGATRAKTEILKSFDLNGFIVREK
jgi:DedD protein